MTLRRPLFRESLAEGIIGGMDQAEADRAALLAVIAAQAEENALLRDQVATLTAQVAALTARLGQTSANSSRPPSSDPPGRSSPPTTPSGRQPGGQPGHPGRFRALLAAEQVDAIIVCLPEHCAGCGAALSATAAASDPADERRQVWDLPAMAAVVTEYRLAARRCAGCDQTTRAPLPVGVGAAGCGARLTAVSATLSGRYRLSKRETAACLKDVFGVDVAVGTVSALEQTMSAALAPVVAEAGGAVQQAAVVNMDETGWRQARRRVWLWTAVTATLTIFQIHASRGGAVARALLGAGWAGIVGSDRGTMYSWLERDRRQVCWAHLKRDFQKLVDWGPGPRPVGARLLTIETQVFRHWRRFRSGELDRAGLEAALAPIQAEMASVLEAGATAGHPVAQSLCRALLRLGPALWTFVTTPGVEPTNNAAEQALRPAVLWRKGSFGTHSPAGSRFVERILTVTASCRQQRRPLLEFLVAAIAAHRTGAPPPSLMTSPAR
jgi:transposase